MVMKENPDKQKKKKKKEKKNYISLIFILITIALLTAVSIYFCTNKFCIGRVIMNYKKLILKIVRVIISMTQLKLKTLIMVIF